MSFLNHSITPIICATNSININLHKIIYNQMSSGNENVPWSRISKNSTFDKTK